LASAKRSLRLGRQVKGRDNECTLGNIVRHVDDLQIPSRLRLTEAYPRTIPAGEFFSRPTQDLPDFFRKRPTIPFVQCAAGNGPAFPGVGDRIFTFVLAEMRVSGCSVLLS
jgi:hypothetical protein